MADKEMKDLETEATEEVVEAAEVSSEETADDNKKAKKSEKKSKDEKKPGFFARIGSLLKRFWKTMKSELKKVTWTPKDELNKGTKLVVAAVVAVGLSIAVIDTFFSWIINTIAGLIG